MQYFDECCKAMQMLHDAGAVFIGQSLRYPSNAMFKTFKDVPMQKRIEVPVFEDIQMGMSIGYALGGYLPVSCFPRMDFLLLAANQLVNHLDKTDRAKVIVRTSVGAKWPLDSGKQHTQDYIAAFRLMLKTVRVIELNCARDVMPGYKQALFGKESFLVVERQDLYGE